MRAETKKRTIFLSVIALLGLLYSTVWILVLLDAEAILTQVPDLPNMPEVLAQQYPLLNAVAWLIRADLFDVVARGLDPMCMVIEINQHSIRHIGIAMFVTWICVFLLLNRTYARRWSRWLARAVQVLILILLILGTIQTLHSFICHKRVVPKWDRKRDQNILNNRDRYSLINRDVLVPYSTQGVEFLEENIGDLHISVDRRGSISLFNARLDKDYLKEIIIRRMARMKCARFFFWIDYRCRADDRAAILGLITNLAPDDAYFVVREGSYSNTVYKGVHCDKAPIDWAR